MSRFRFLSYNENNASEGLKNLVLTAQDSQGDNPLKDVRLLRHKGSTFKAKTTDTVICWGYSKELPPEWSNARVINKPSAIQIACDKLKFFNACADAGADSPRIPPFTTDKGVASNWLAEGKTVFARTVLRGNSGEGIVDISTQEQLDQIPDRTLLVQYIPKKMEFRLHVNAERGVFDFQRKVFKNRNDEKAEVGIDPNWRIRNFKNGFIFERQGIAEITPPDCIEQAIKAVRVCGLDFGAVDIIYNVHRKEAYVLEVNTAPGLEGTTCDKYLSMFKDMFNDAR